MIGIFFQYLIGLTLLRSTKIGKSNDKLISMFKSYSLRNGFDICKDKTPPSTPNPSEPSSKKEDIKSNKFINTDIPKDIAEKIDKFNDNLSL